MWATYNGDHMSMYGVNAGIPKTLIRNMIANIADASDPALANVLRDILDTPVSPELLPADSAGAIAQKTEDLVGPYELHDFFLYWVVRHGFGPAKVPDPADLLFQVVDGLFPIDHHAITPPFYARPFHLSALAFMTSPAVLFPSCGMFDHSAFRWQVLHHIPRGHRSAVNANLTSFPQIGHGFSSGSFMSASSPLSVPRLD